MNTTNTERDDPASFPYFESHNFEGWARQFQTLAESTGDSALAFDPEKTKKDSLLLSPELHFEIFRLELPAGRQLIAP